MRDSAVALLEMAAVRTVERRAGQRLNRGESLPVAPREDRPVVSRAAADRLARILGGELPRLLPEWLAAAAGAGLRLPAYLLPEVLDRAARDRSLRSHAGALAGQRGRWLARVGAAQWAYLLEEPTGDGETWQLGTPGDRRELMRRMRRDDPGAAREMLAGTWEKETPDDRAAFLAAFGEGLSMDDEEFLEAALDDRRREVRQCAADLLTRLPESRLARRMVARAGQCLRPADTGPGSDSDSGSGSGSGSDSGFGFGFGFGSGSGSGSASGDSGSASRPGSDSARPGFASGPGPGFASGPGSGFASRPGSGPASRPGPGPASRPGSGSGAVERGPVRRVVVEPPSACDAAAQRDGVRPTPPRGTGEKGWWLQQIVARTPLTYWTELFGAEPDAIVRMDFGDWQREVRGGWVRAAVLQRDPAWARALFAWDPLAELLAALPAGEREELAAGFVREQAVDGQMIMVLGGAEAPWGPVLTRAVLAKIVEVAGEQPWNVDELARLVAERADPGLHAAAERLSSEPSVQAIAAVLRFRSDMLKELS
ncbi:hypothetical protein HNP84_000865 [Thermocatellispora tengchongensis]|uniref:Uncharacterized protein n=1 Tax=Thermocatellispora tengchongensis TaxID=1073253 RepID=A0A840NWH2_9ACTN|nr:DUF5691 domain-containing protein [Thermocatellispora tengchongensis]MBB5131159.1 hypothetical protein [Thermocatellispora tengchongensis]